MKRDYANYQVSLKILLKKNDRVLLLKNPDGTKFDLPGGSIDDTEHEISLSAILNREVTEELGESLKYKLGKLLFQFRRHFPKQNRHVFLTIYDAEYVSGEIQISDEHGEMLWINPTKFEFSEEQFMSKEEYLSFKKYFGKL